MHLTSLEKETIILYNEAEGTASVYTHNAALRRKLEGLALERADECKLERVSHEGQAVEYIVPKKWVKINAGRVLTEEQRAALIEAGRKTAFQPRKAGQIAGPEG